MLDCPDDNQPLEKQKWLEYDRKALAHITLCVKPSELIHIKNCKCANEAWKTLSQLYCADGPMRKVNLFKKLVRFEFKSSEKFANQMNDFCTTIDNLREIDVKVPADLLSILLLCSLPDEMDSFVVAIESRDVLPTFEQLKVKVLEEERRRGDKYESNGESVLAAKLAVNKGFAHNKSCEKQNPHSYKPRDWTKVKCYACGKRGHIQSQCKTIIPKGKSSAVSAVLSVFSPKNFVTKGNLWILDSGASSHMCNDQRLFVNMVNNERTVVLASGDFVVAKGLGKICVKSNCSEIILRDVLFVPNLRGNFLSVSQILRNNNTVQFDRTNAKVKTEDGKEIFSAKMCDGIFYVQFLKSEVQFVNAISNVEQNKTELWHKRFGHLNYKDLCLLSRREMVRGLNVIIPTNLTCTTCAVCKISKNSFPSFSRVLTSDVLQLVHTDICGPMKVKSQGGSRYFMTLIDDYSRYVYICFLRHKSEAFEKFKTFLYEAEKQTGRKLKCLRSDNGREYINSKFETFLKQNGIRHQTTVAYSPQQNGVAERANRTLVEMARCMLEASKLPQSLWTEAINTASYIRNRCPTKVLSQETPYERWYGRKPSVSHLRVFGCDAVALKSGPGNSKLEPKGLQLIFVGYAELSKGYRLYNKETKQIVISRNILFFEDKNSYREDDYADATKFICEGLNDEEEYDGIQTQQASVRCGDMSGDKEGVVFEPTPAASTHDVNDDITDESTTEEEEVVEPGKRKRGRPKIQRDGKVGRPRKIYVMESLNTVITNPVSVAEAMKSSESSQWKDAMQAEYHSLLKNDTWELVDCPRGKNVIGSKWVFSTKYNPNGTIEKFKARLVAQGCKQIYGEDFYETYSPVARHSTIRLMLALSAKHKLLVNHIDIVSAYLNGELEEEVYMRQPEMFTNQEHTNKVCRLKKSIYGLKQAGRYWNIKINSLLSKIGFRRCRTDNCVYIMTNQKEINIIALYVDDIILACSLESTMKRIINELGAALEAVDRGPICYYLGIQIEREGLRGAISIHQEKYTKDLLEKWNMQECKAASTPYVEGIILEKCSVQDCVGDHLKEYQSLLGALTYLAITTRPDIAHTVSKLAQHHSHPHKSHFVAAKHVLRYLKAKPKGILTYTPDSDLLICFTDADWGADTSDRKSISGYAVFYGNGVIAWESKKQPIVSLSTMEAEYVAMCQGAKEIAFLRNLIKEMGFQQSVKDATTIFCDNQGAQFAVKNPILHKRSKHIDIRYHYIREQFTSGEVDVTYIPSEENAADILTKPLSPKKNIIMIAIC